jgi:hypothetical protein
MKKILFITLFATQFMLANNLSITNVTKVDANHLSFDVSWDNSWRTSTYKDAAWIFIKYKNSSGKWSHLDLSSASGSGFIYNSYLDKKGVMLSRNTSGIGTINGTVTVSFNGGIIGSFPDFKVFGIEMVYINQGAFYVGDGEGTSSRFHQGNDVNIPYHIQNSGLMTVGNTANNINGSLAVNIPATFPNGYNGFYMMKYEITQEQYAEFLNTLTAQQQQSRTETDLSAITASNRFVTRATSTPDYRNGIACDANATNAQPITFYCDLNNNAIPNENDDGQNIATACNIADVTAYMDWAALRLATEFEYEKACRGTAYPIVDEMANGTTLAINKIGTVNYGKPNESVLNINTNGLINFSTLYLLRVGVFATATSTRLQSGAGFYGNTELSGNASEFYVSPTETTYTGNLGDGLLDVNGNQNQWSLSGSFFPKGNYADSVSKRNLNYLIAAYVHRNLNSRGCR